MTGHVILRNKNQSFWRPKGFGVDPVSKDYGATSSEENLPEPEFEVQTLDQKQVRDAAAEPSAEGRSL